MFTEAKTTAPKIEIRDIPASFQIVNVPAFIFRVCGLSSADQIALGAAYGFRNQDHTNVSYISKCIGITRETLSTRFNGLVERGLMRRIAISKRKAKFVLAPCLLKLAKEQPSEEVTSDVKKEVSERKGSITSTVREPLHDNKIYKEKKKKRAAKPPVVVFEPEKELQSITETIEQDHGKLSASDRKFINSTFEKYCSDNSHQLNAAWAMDYCESGFEMRIQRQHRTARCSTARDKHLATVVQGIELGTQLRERKNTLMISNLCTPTKTHYSEAERTSRDWADEYQFRFTEDV